MNQKVNLAVALPTTIRPVHPDDFNAWLPLFDGYNAFYGREGPTALAPSITQTTWQRFFDPSEPVFALVAERSEFARRPWD
jgi:hypothetical protein